MAPSPQKGSLVRLSVFKAQALSFLGSLLCLYLQAASAFPDFIRLLIRGLLPPRRLLSLLTDPPRAHLSICTLRVIVLHLPLDFTLLHVLHPCGEWAPSLAWSSVCENKRLRGRSDFLGERSLFLSTQGLGYALFHRDTWGLSSRAESLRSSVLRAPAHLPPVWTSLWWDAFSGAWTGDILVCF